MELITQTTQEHYKSPVSLLIAEHRTFINTNVNYHSVHLISTHGYHGSKQ